MLYYNVTSTMLHVHTDIFMKVYSYSINSVTTMVVTLPPSPLRSVSDREDSIYLSLLCGPSDALGTWSDSPSAPSPLFLQGLRMVPNYFPPAHSLPRQPCTGRTSWGTSPPLAPTIGYSRFPQRQSLARRQPHRALADLACEWGRHFHSTAPITRHRTQDKWTSWRATLIRTPVDQPFALQQKAQSTYDQSFSMGLLVFILCRLSITLSATFALPAAMSSSVL